jgi:hypothetical protein
MKKKTRGDKKNKGRENEKMMGKIVGVGRATTESWRPPGDSKSAYSSLDHRKRGIPRYTLLRALNPFTS